MKGVSVLRRLFGLSSVCLLLLVLWVIPAVAAEQTAAVVEQALSDTLDLWREGRYEQLFDQLARRGKTSREHFVRIMRDTQVRPSCCWQKLQNVKLLNERRSEVTVFATVGLEGTPEVNGATSREFRLNNEGGTWKMQLADIVSLAGQKKKSTRHRKH